jgi:hypothetical protein
LLGNESVNTHRDNEYAAIEDIRCYAMDVFFAWSDPRLYNEKPAITDSSVGGVVRSHKCPVKYSDMGNVVKS